MDGSMAPTGPKVTIARKASADYTTGRRVFFKYRDLGVQDATGGKIRAQVMEALTGMTEPTGWHVHHCEAQFVYVLKGWVDRVFASGRIYGGAKIYETGLGNSQKRGLVLLTTGGGPDMYGGYGVNPPLASVLAPVQHGVFWFNGFLPLAPFVAWSPARITPEEREKYLAALNARLQDLTTEPPQVLPPLADFPGWSTDAKKRFMVTVTRLKPMDDTFKSLIAAEQAPLAEWRRLGLMLDFHMMPPAADPWHAYIVFRETDAAAVQRHLDTLPLARWMGFQVIEVT
jgi:hypothetical protein